MKTRLIIIFSMIALLFSSATIVLAPTSTLSVNERPTRELLYECWGTVYHAVTKQCDDTPLVTGSGYKINPEIASTQRILAISHEMLQDKWRLSMLKDTINDQRFRGKICYGDSVWVESPTDSLGNYIYPKINGWWIVHDAKNKRYKNSIDFLQTVGDSELYNDDPMWSGKFNDVKIYKYHDRT